MLPSTSVTSLVNMVMRRDCLDQVTTIILKFSKILILEFVGQLLILFNSQQTWFRQCKFSIMTIHYTPHLIKCARNPRVKSKPLLTSPPSEGSLTDILVRKPSSSSAPSIVDPKVLLELFSMYREWQEENVKKLSQKQEEIENKIEIADALSVKLKQRFNYSVTAMKTSSQHLCGVHALQVEIGELKGRLTEVISNCDAVCKRISAEGPESLQSSVKPLVICTAHQEHQS
ncbi:uncharacterized protein LOC133726568 isoform X2 [Rosa rugosa]|uniref:uncharacterized protein LOC133726568 isoform X2 n=1 Tax=Rosa rugosa TaxID=74645 RepID=UPI002B410617|nr:uncharacterized protein LOC133726568 isoform X2 [Rosa rugosa]